MMFIGEPMHHVSLLFYIPFANEKEAIDLSLDFDRTMKRPLTDVVDVMVVSIWLVES